MKKDRLALAMTWIGQSSPATKLFPFCPGKQFDVTITIPHLSCHDERVRKKTKGQLTSVEEKTGKGSILSQPFL